MDCREIERNLRAYLDDELDPRLRTVLARHLPGCAACAQRLALLESASALFRGLPPPPAAADFDFEPIPRETASSAAGRSWREFFPAARGTRWALAAGSVAAVLLLAGVATFESRRRAAPERGVEAFFANRRPYHAGAADLSVQDAPTLQPGERPWRSRQGREPFAPDHHQS